MLVVSDVETSHFIYTANQMTGFHMNTTMGINRLMETLKQNRLSNTCFMLIIIKVMMGQ